MMPPLARLAALALALAAAPLAAQERPDRIVSIGGAVTEIVYALGEEDRLVARDTTSTYPPEASTLTDIGYIRRLSPEGVLSVRPDLIVTEAGAGPPEAVEVIGSAGIPFVEIPEGFTRDAILQKITAVGAALDVPDKAAALRDQVATDLRRVGAAAEVADKRVLFILSMQGGRIMASGTGTAADGIIALAGARNAVTAFEGYKPLTDEAIAAARPDVILMMDRGEGHETARAQVLSHPAIASTPAGEAGALVRMDGLYLLGFSVRTAAAARDLAAALETVGR
ncbi:iron complex transport system substrate-binding protein [Tranquillimonas rosea]|uniref:Iron complex transport system substrate-binding protein n=2 Tax=Tranquillimonas rosea TaxID=641238 RepID=A0A1H9SRT2_9RHOB|nr:iron complex transport system substrate-binding protein [Tranquillimonas rosea]